MSSFFSHIYSKSFEKKAYSFGYHSDDGGLFCGVGFSRSKFESFKAGDVVGVGVDLRSGTFFVTKNGIAVSTDLEVPRHANLFPCLGIDSLDICEANFGQKPFLFNVNFAEMEHSLKVLNCKNMVRSRQIYLEDLLAKHNEDYRGRLMDGVWEVMKEELEMYFGEDFKNDIHRIITEGNSAAQFGSFFHQVLPILNFLGRDFEEDGIFKDFDDQDDYQEEREQIQEEEDD